jgi:hypothetical protein
MMDTAQQIVTQMAQGNLPPWSTAFQIASNRSCLREQSRPPGSDYQVTREDFQIWQDALGRRDDVQFLLYPGLSHTFMPVEGGQKATPATYTKVGHVAEEVVNVIGNWINRREKNWFK